MEERTVVSKVFPALWGNPVDQVAKYIDWVIENWDEDFQFLTDAAIKLDFADFKEFSEK